MLLVVSLLFAGSRCETTVPPVHRGYEGCPASRGVISKDEWWQGGPPRGAPGLAIFWCSNANGGLLYWLVEGAEASREGEADLVLALSADELLIDAVAGSTGYLTQRMIP